MDFNQFDSRAQAEIGTPMQILDQWTDEPMMDGDKPCRVIVRGTASKTMQTIMRNKQRAAMTAHKKGKGDDEARVMEDVHNQLCEGATPFIIGFENVSRGDKPATADDAGWFLNLSFPEMGVKVDEDGNVITVLSNVTDDDGQVVYKENGEPLQELVPEFEMKNNPFAKQVGEFAGKQANRLGNAKKG